MIMQEALPGIKRFLKPVGLNERMRGLVVRCIAAFALHWGRMSAVQAAGAVRSEPRHRAQICRFLGRKYWARLRMLRRLQGELLALESEGGRFVYLTDQTLCSQQGDKTENTYSSGNRQRRPRKGRRYNKYKHARKRCHCFVMGLLITPSGLRIPFRRSYYTQEYCQKKGRAYRKQTELAAEMIRELPLPEGTEVVVLGDTAFDAAVIREACAERHYTWIVPMNPERVLAERKPRPRVWSLAKGLTAQQFKPVRLYPGRGSYVAMRRLSAYRIGPKVKPRTFYVHQESRVVHSVGEVQLVFSTRTCPSAGPKVEVQKILMTNNRRLRAAEIVELYDLRWQIELFFKELKSTLGFDQYRFRRFEAVEGWLELVLVTFLYLEWHRARQLQNSRLAKEEKERWRRQRTHGMCVAMRQATEHADLEHLAGALHTQGGVRRLRRKLAKAIQAEYRLVA
ncbi:MAG: transposase [Terriglobales bacterium]